MSSHLATAGNAPDLESICQRVREKSASYDQYNFNSTHNDFLKAFFDLAQEYDSLEDFYRICIAVPLEIKGIASALYLCEEPGKPLRLVCDSERGVLAEPEEAAAPVCLQSRPYECDGSYIMPICSKQPFGEEPSSVKESKEQGLRLANLSCGPSGICCRGRILGMFAVRSLEDLSTSDRFFLAKYTNRIGYNLDNRLIARQNINHLKFINTLVLDIEHNVIVPNMYFKHLFNQLRKKIVELDLIAADIKDMSVSGQIPVNLEKGLARCNAVRSDLLSYHQELVKHHANVSLFLESLFRREHFERGHLVLRPKRCFVEKEVILPQLEHYASRFKAANITIERAKNMYEEEFQLFVDVGLLSQVYANLLSNAAKYTQEIIDHRGRPRKAVAYGRERINDYPEPGKQGVKLNIFTTGPQLSSEEGQRLFSEGVRGENTESIPGTGHGLSFIRYVIEMHGGIVGHEATEEGNNFYFILPVPPIAYPPVSVGEVE